PEVGEENRVDQLRLAAGELRNEGDYQLILVQALEQALDLQVGLGVGELLLRQPFVQPGNTGRQPSPPIAVGFKTGSQFPRLRHCPYLPGVSTILGSDSSINRAKTRP